MKKILTILLTVLMIAGMAACSSTEQESQEEAKTITITALNAAKEEIELEVPYDPARVVTLDMAALDILDNLGLGDRIVGSSNISLDYLSAYSDVANLGTIKEADMEAVMQCEPDIIFIGGRLSNSYDALSEIAPVVFLATDTDEGLVESIKKNSKVIASIFGKEEETDEKIAAYEDRIQALAEFAAGHTAVLGMATSGSFNLLGNDGRCSLIPNEIGFENVGLAGITESNSGSRGGSQGSHGGSGSEGSQGSHGGSGESGSSESGNENSGAVTATHGNEVSFELIVDLDPEYIFVMDRDSAIGTNGAQLAKDIVENELIMQTQAYQNGNIVYLEHPGVWYTAEGGITALEIMLEDLESALGVGTN